MRGRKAAERGAEAERGRGRGRRAESLPAGVGGGWPGARLTGRLTEYWLTEG